jgi:hypothetical protein
MSEQKLTVEDVIKNSDLSETMQKLHIDFCRFLKDNGFSIEPEGHTEDDASGWIILHTVECVGHTNYANACVWIDVCDFGGSDSTDDALKEFAWVNVRNCEHFSSGGKQCGCGRQPGFSKMIFGKKHENLCFAFLEFMNPDAETFEGIKKLMLLFKQNKNSMQHSS